jgi:hypothetical protein
VPEQRMACESYSRDAFIKWIPFLVKSELFVFVPDHLYSMGIPWSKNVSNRTMHVKCYEGTMECCRN